MKTKSVIDLSGEKFGRLTVISLSKMRGNKGQYKWDCVCSCGNKHLVTGESLRSGKSKSCGCLLIESRKAKGDRKEALLKFLYSPLKKRHNYKFNNSPYLSFEDFKKLSLQNCYYCGTVPINQIEDIRYETRYGKKEKLYISNTILLFNGIDRVDSLKGYEKWNVVSCCKHCNIAKNSLPQIDFKELIIKIYKHWAVQSP